MKTLLYFGAKTCQPCKAMLPIVQSVAAEQQIKLVIYDRDECGELARSYGVMGVPCLIRLDDGVMGDRLVGLYQKGKIEALVKG